MSFPLTPPGFRPVRIDDGGLVTVAVVFSVYIPDLRPVSPNNCGLVTFTVEFPVFVEPSLIPELVNDRLSLKRGFRGRILLLGELATFGGAGGVAGMLGLIETGHARDVRG